ncbi:MAG: hypothetical protein LBQ60_07360 [Bacteroidales bacterium]|jgi:mannitol-1-phosphate 5-dehydrogenase|nr:hypothetical protein [Bacteroidales bacterium]
MKKLVLFGAGKIGRSFIGQLFSRSGYEVVFIDKDMEIINALNRDKSYNVHICDEHDTIIPVTNVRGIPADHTYAILQEISSADIVSVSVGKNALPHIAGPLSAGLQQREKDHPGTPVDIILAENMRNASEYFYSLLERSLPGYPLSAQVGLVETSIGKMVPLLPVSAKDPLSVSAEAYNTLIVDKKAFKTPIPRIAGIDAKENMKAWVDRKLFVHNFGHAVVAYQGYLRHPEHTYIWEVLEDSAIREAARTSMQESATILQAMYPGEFTETELTDHIDDLLSRFGNRKLGDTVFRVGCDLYRKLSHDDRIVTPLLYGYRYELPVDNILDTLWTALRFKATGTDGSMFSGDIDFHTELNRYGTKYILQKVCGLDENVLNRVRQNISQNFYK